MAGAGDSLALPAHAASGASVFFCARLGLQQFQLWLPPFHFPRARSLKRQSVASSRVTLCATAALLACSCKYSKLTLTIGNRCLLLGVACPLWEPKGLLEKKRFARQCGSVAEFRAMRKPTLIFCFLRAEVSVHP